MGLCVIGAVSMFLPFATGLGYWNSRIDLGIIKLDFGSLAPPGFVTWHGNLIIYLYIVLFGFLAAMSPLRPVPIWRSLSVAAVAALTLLLMLLCYYGSRWVLHGWRVGGWLNIAAATGLHILCFVELYQAAGRAQRRRVIARPADSGATTAVETARTEPIPTA
jgi:hypothetical protein